MTAITPWIYLFAGIGFLVFAGTAGVMIAAMIANHVEDRRKRAEIE